MRTVWRITAVALAIGLAADLAVGTEVPGFTAAIGFAGCAAIVVISKWLGRALLQRPEAYWADAAAQEGLGEGTGGAG